jgi:3-oxoacyl-[acyl-carrier-protein] synthase II
MSASPRRAVITGLGLITPLGLDLPSVWEALRAGRGGVRRITSFDPGALPVQFGGEVADFDARVYLDRKDRKQLKTMPPTSRFAVVGARFALADSGVDRGRLDPERFGVVLGAGTVPGDLGQLGAAAVASVAGPDGPVDLRRWGAEGMANIPPMWMLNHIPNMSACHVSILNDARGPNNSVTQTDAGAVLALAEARRMIGRDRGDFFLVGGADARINPITLVRRCLFSPLSRSNEEPGKACRPFDRHRDGMVLGEGAGLLVLEELGHARRRGARIYAEVVGFGAAFDRGRGGRGLARAVRRALAEAGVGPGEVDHVNAHGVGTVEGDAWEARGLHEVFGACDPAPGVFAAKGYFGNAGAAGGGVELAVSLLALAHGLLPATLNHEEPDPACPVRVVREPRLVRRPYFLKVSCTEAGQCAAVVCRKWE